MRAGLAQIRMVQTLREVHRHFAGPVAQLATAAFLCGRAHGQRAAEATDELIPAAPAMVADALCHPGLQEQFAEIDEIAAEATLQVVGTLQYAVGQAHAVDLLSQWEGFARFCADVLEMDALSLVLAFGLGAGDLATDVRAVYPQVSACEAEVSRWCEQWGQRWARWFGRRR